MGGLVGFSAVGDVENSYSIGNVTGEDGAVGGLIGRAYSTNIIFSYWNIETSGQEQSAGGEGRTTVEMTSVPRPENTYVDWDFENTWNQTNNNYPLLYLPTQEVPPKMEICTPIDLDNIRNRLNGNYTPHFPE